MKRQFLKKHSIIKITAKDSQIGKVSGLCLGADDYLTKPFNIDEFIARVRSLIRRFTVLNNFTRNYSFRICDLPSQPCS